ncbi:hypothetical protein GCM10027586_00820 [Kineococcus gypseus]|uniref:hypothetical protein n=1 Tax=Kineococcus gypseus TaxID=1637102 RepID=UPI003D7CCC9A
MQLHASTNDLLGWLDDGELPRNAERLLRSASLLVTDATRAAVYPTRPDGTPLVQATSDALRDATCAQVAAWLALGIDPAKGAAGVAPQASSKSIGGASVQYAVYASTAEAAARSATTLCDEAARLLAHAGLLTAQVAVW